MKKIMLILSFLLIAATPITQALDDAVSFLIDRQPQHPKNGDREYSARMADALERAGDTYDVDPFLLAAMAAVESHYRPDVLSGKTKGAAGEIGILQCGPDCKRACPHFMDDALGQAMCGARWLKHAIDSCRHVKCKKHSAEWHGLVMYASGHYCDPPPDTPFAWKANKRIRLRDRLKNRFHGIDR